MKIQILWEQGGRLHMVRKQVYNDTEKNRDISLLFSGMEECAPNHLFFGRRDHYVLHYIVKGEGKVFLEGKTVHLKRGAAFIIFPMQKNRYTASEVNPWTYRWIGFTGKAAKEILKQFGIDEKNLVMEQQYSLEIEDLFKESYQVLKLQEPGFQAKSASILIDIFWKLSHTRRKRPIMKAKQIDYIKTAKQFIENHYMTSINVSKIADYLGIHRSHLARLFRESESTSLQVYLMNYRVEKAKDLLIHNDDAIAEVAASVGYEHYFTFEKRFKEITGTTPTEFRHAHRIHGPEFIYE